MSLTKENWMVPKDKINKDYKYFKEIKLLSFSYHLLARCHESKTN